MQARLVLAPAAAKKTVEFVVSGTGISFAPESPIFDSFSAISDLVMTRGLGGFDIGLAMVRELTEFHGARVWCRESRMFPVWLQAGFWGLVAGSALLIGAALGYFARIPQRLIAAIMAFGSGVLISALSFDLMDEAYKRGGFDSTAIGFVGGAAMYTAANWYLARRGAKHRKRSGGHQASEEVQRGSGSAIAIGALLDGIPESIVIGVSMIWGGAVSWVAVVAIFLSNLPEGLSSSAGMKKAGRSATYVFGVWTSIAVISGGAALVGYTVFRRFSPEVIAATTAVAAGAILAMLSDTMIPEAFEEAHEFAGLITVFGFLVAFILTKISL